jgi:hypothetical protein
MTWEGKLRGTVRNGGKRREGKKRMNGENGVGMKRKQESEKWGKLRKSGKWKVGGWLGSRTKRNTHAQSLLSPNRTAGQDQVHSSRQPY